MESKRAIVELAAVIQGEGSLMGVPHILIRMSGCPLRCEFKGGTKCDTAYASYMAEDGKYSLKDIVDTFEANPRINHAMITGGEPTANVELLDEIIGLCRGAFKHITVETSGYQYDDSIDAVDLISISPKLSNSIPKSDRDKILHNEARLKDTDINMMMRSAKDYQLKYVITDEDDIIEATNHAREIGAPIDKVWFMPEGISETQLKSRRAWLMDECIKRGANYSDRLHIAAYGTDKRGV